LKKVAKENVAPQMIIGMRCADVMRYSEQSTEPWRPGWRIEPLQPNTEPDEAIRKDMQDAALFLQNSCTELAIDKANERDQAKLKSFADFLSAATRDTLTYAAIALWKDTDNQGKVKGYTLLPAGNIRLTGQTDNEGHFTVGGFKGNDKIHCVLVDDTKTIVQAFTREELTFYVRNPRTDLDVYGYGYPEIEIAIRLIQGFQNALDMNIDTFNRNAIPPGLLVLSGAQVTQKQLDILNRMWTNLKKGITKAWALPVIGMQGDAKVELVDLSRMKGNEAYYKDFMNMLAGALCTVWEFPVRRLGYRISGHGHDTQPVPGSSTEIVDEDDPGLAPLLSHLEGLINQYLIWTRWPAIRFRFTGKNPKEDAREYEARMNAMTLAETRAASHLPPLEDLVKGEDMKKIAKIMALAPHNPNMSSAFQSIISIYAKSEFEPEEEGMGGGGGDMPAPGNRMQAKKDPAKSEHHGATSGVRRDSAAEKRKNGAA
jgi:hypothetical protein